MGKSVVGIDIGRRTLRAVEVADADRARPTLLRFQQLPLPEGAVSRGEVLEPHTVASSLKQLWSKGGFKSRDVILGMGNQRVLARDLTVPRASQERIRESLPFQVQDMLPVPVADALLDFYPVSEGESEHGPVVHGLLIAAVKDAVLANVNAVHLAGLNVVGVDLIPFALSRVLLPRGGKGTVALIDIGGASTSVVIVSDGVPQFVRLIPTGGDDLSQALATRLEITNDEADALKSELGLARQLQSAEQQRSVEIIYEITNELLSSLRNTINYYVNTRPDRPVTGIVLTGGASRLPGFVETLGNFTRLTVTPGDPFVGLALSKSLKADELRQTHGSLAVALGLAVGSAL